MYEGYENLTSKWKERKTMEALQVFYKNVPQRKLPSLSLGLSQIEPRFRSTTIFIYKKIYQEEITGMDILEGILIS